MAKDTTHRLLSETWAIVLPSPYRSLSMPSLHCFVELRAFQWQESRFFFNSTAWSGTDAKTFLELAVFPSGRPAHSAVVFSIFNHPLFSKPLTLLAVPVKREKEEIEWNMFPSIAMLLFAYAGFKESHDPSNETSFFKASWFSNRWQCESLYQLGPAACFYMVMVIQTPLLISDRENCKTHVFLSL